MRLLVSIIACLSLLVAFPFLAATEKSESSSIPAPGRIYEIKGKRQALGEYHGQLELRPISRTRVAAVRKVRYDNFLFQGRHLEEIWSGEGKLEADNLDLQFNLKQADVFDKVDEFRHLEGQFKFPLKVKYALKLSVETKRVRLSVPDFVMDELGAFGPAGETPLWRDERHAVLSRGDCFQLVGKWAKLSLFLPMTIKLQFAPLMKPYLQRPEFEGENQYFIYDPTDFDFLRQNPDCIRVNNKVLDYISMVEASLRTDAYGHSLSAKARLFEDEMKKDHLNELGLYSGAIFDTARNERIGFTVNGDGALWSGMYAGSEAMRYLVTGEKDALENFRRVLKGLMLLMDLTGDPREFARTAEPMRPGDRLEGPWRQGIAPYQQIKYVEGGNNDMVKGLFHAFAWAYEILPENDPLLQEVSEHARRLPLLKVAAKEKIHPGNSSCAAGLAALASGKKEDLQKYLRFYSFAMRPIEILNLDKGFYFGGIADWSGVNLGMVAELSEILVAKNLLRRFANEDVETRESISVALKHFRQKLVDTWSIYEPARRDFITIGASAFAASDPVQLRFPEGSKPQSWSRRDKWEASRALSIWALREMPYESSKHELCFDYRLKPEWCASAWPLRPWKMFVEDTTVEYHLQGAYDYPLFEGHAYDTDIVWTSAFRYNGHCHPEHRHGRFDFLHTYWLGRLSGLIDESS